MFKKKKKCSDRTKEVRSEEKKKVMAKTLEHLKMLREILEGKKQTA